MTAKLVLENGLVFEGSSFGAETETHGEAVFNTSLTGYQEVITDPSYCGQIVTMTNPLIGNYGINDDDLESSHPRVAGFVVREYSEFYSNHRATASLGSWLRRFGVPAIQGVDTRMLTRVIRTSGAMRAVLSATGTDVATLLEKVKAAPSMSGLDLAREVTCAEPYSWDAVDTTPYALGPGEGTELRRQPHVVVYDYGIKRNILRRLRSHGCRLTVVPASFPAADVLAMNPDGVFLSNGPGDPEAVRYGIASIRALLGKKPIFGICLGHQLLALALGGKTYKLKFGHRGANHPVKNLLTNEIEITSQNHGFAVDPDSLDPAAVEITHVNLNDGTNEGLRHRHLPLFSVQYHPEASPGPHDSDYLFRSFSRMLAEHAAVPSS
ncbi:MAG TPA: glutamine-hydrolyzing carbamoyl-phosphate synthase small subunit [Bacteroidota bacterium]|nr:glutamine-hydrolyzing carbamoyl-phosphate synthase small subunit [Bacteroidota bacterium]